MVCSYAPYVICSIFFLAFGNKTWIWCLGAFLGWIALPLMSANLEAVNRLNIPVEIQGRVFAARNSFQFFTIPVGYFLGGLLVDKVFEPIMTMQTADNLLTKLFGVGKGSGAAFMFISLRKNDCRYRIPPGLASTSFP